MRPDLTLVDQAFLGLVHELDRVFHSQDVPELGLVEVVDHRSECGGLARAGGAGHQHHTAGLQCQVAKNLGRVELFQRQDLAGNGPEHCAGTPVVVESVDPEPRQPVNLK